MKSFYLLLGAFLLFTAASDVLAEYNIALVDVNRVLNESKEAKVKRKELDEVSLAAKKKLEEKKDSLKNLEKKLQDKKVGADSKEAENYRSEASKFTRQLKDAEEDLKRTFLKTNKELTDKTLKVIAQYAKAKNIDLVLDKSERPGGPVLFGNPATDITDDVIANLNQ